MPEVMEKRIVVSYYGFRVYFLSNLLYLFLVIPFIIFILSQTIPEKIRERNTGDFAKGFREGMAIDSILKDSLDTEDLDSLISVAVEIGEAIADSIAEAENDQRIVLSPAGVTVVEDGEVVEEEEDSPFRRYFNLFIILSLLSYIAGLIYNQPFKRYFRRYRRKQDIPEGLKAYCKKHLARTPLVNALIIFLPGALALAWSFGFFLTRGAADSGIEGQEFREFFFLATLAVFLEFLFAFYWQKHRVHIRYIHHVFSPEELRSRLSPDKKDRIRSRLVLATTMTTFLPLLIVMAYLVKSITTVRSLDLETLDPQAWNILFGPWGDMIDNGKELFNLEKLKWMLYVNAVDTLSMIIGISTGILASLIYLLLFIRWTNRDITYPVKEMLYHIRNTRAGQTEQYTMVRTNDELGELAEGYNEMARKIHEHVSHISEMNRNLENTVEERTREVVMQKEEIEAQKEEIEAQLDLVTRQKDTISNQNEQILDSIHYARQIQSAIIPPLDQLGKNFSDHFVLFKPRDIVSGDFYWISRQADHLMLAAADCTGHGVPGAFLSVLGISSLNKIVSRDPQATAGGILEQLRAEIIGSMHQTGGSNGSQDGIEIALGIFDLEKQTLNFAGANRPLYLVREDKVIHYRGDRMPIGIYEQEPRPFTTHAIPLQRGDTLYMFSDGYADQLGGSRRKTYRVMNFRKLLLEIRSMDMESQRRILLDRHREWKGDAEQIDDILVIGVRI